MREPAIGAFGAFLAPHPGDWASARTPGRRHPRRGTGMRSVRSNPAATSCGLTLPSARVCASATAATATHAAWAARSSICSTAARALAVIWLGERVEDIGEGAPRASRTLLQCDAVPGRRARRLGGVDERRGTIGGRGRRLAQQRARRPARAPGTIRVAGRRSCGVERRAHVGMAKPLRDIGGIERRDANGGDTGSDGGQQRAGLTRCQDDRRVGRAAPRAT